MTIMSNRSVMMSVRAALGDRSMADPNYDEDAGLKMKPRLLRMRSRSSPTSKLLSKNVGNNVRVYFFEQTGQTFI